MDMLRLTFYCHRKESKIKERQEILLKDKIQNIFHHLYYKYRITTVQLHRGKIRVNHKQTLHLMHELGIRDRIKFRYATATNSKHNHPICLTSTKGNPYNNAHVESLFKTLKQEEVYLWQYETYLNVAIRIPYFILDVYNRKGLHSALGYWPTEEFEDLTFENAYRESKKAKTLFV